MADAPDGSAGAVPNPNASKKAVPPGSRKPDAQGRPKSDPKGVADHKAMELEDEFRTKHLGVMGVLGWIL